MDKIFHLEILVYKLGASLRWDSSRLCVPWHLATTVQCIYLMEQIISVVYLLDAHLLDLLLNRCKESAGLQLRSESHRGPIPQHKMEREGAESWQY